MNTLVVIDVQREYNTPGRLFNIDSIGDSLTNGKCVLDHARKQGWHIVHVRHMQDGDIFNPKSEYSGFIDGFNPQGGEREIHKGNFSCFSSEEFTKELESRKSDQVFVIGYGTTMCVISTIIDGYHRGYSMNLVADATRAKKSDFDEQSTQQHAISILNTFCSVKSTKEILNA